MKGFDEADEALSVTSALLERGYSEADVNKIWGHNFLRALTDAQNLAA